MPRLSLYKPNKTNDYKFLDRTIREMYTVGGIDIFVHKYLGPEATGDLSSAETGDATQPSYDSENPLFIEDLLLLENRDRVYDDSVYIMRGVYTVSDLDFDLTQFGLFLNNDTLFITFHYNDMIDSLGRKLMSGDVLEIPNLKDYHPLDTGQPTPLPRYYVIQDAAFASEGFTPTWQPHLWRVKATPMVGAQEYNSILEKSNSSGTDWDPGNFYPAGTKVLLGGLEYTAKIDVPAGTELANTTYWEQTTPESFLDTITTKSKDLEINDAILTQAEAEVPLSGYDVTKFYIVASDEEGNPVTPAGDEEADASTISNNTPRSDGYTMGYLTGDGIPPNGLPVTPGVSFPISADAGDYCLRLDYKPNRLFRYNGTRWVHIESAVRTDLTPGSSNESQRSEFVNNTDTVQTTDRGLIPSRQSLSDALKPEADN